MALGGLKGGRADWLVEKATELGAWALRPLLTHRSRTIGVFHCPSMFSSSMLRICVKVGANELHVGVCSCIA